MSEHKKLLLERFIKFSVVGVLNTVIHLIFFSLFVKVGIHYLSSQILGFIVVNAITFFINKHWTFQNKDRRATKQFILYISGRVFTLGVTLLQTWILVENFAVDPFICQITAVGFNVVLNFLFSQIFIFTHTHKSKQEYVSPSKHLFSHLNPSKDQFKSLKPEKKIKVTYVVPLFKEHHRVQPKSSTNPHGEDCIKIKIDQLNELFSLNSDYEWKMIFVDDGDVAFQSGRVALKELTNRFPELLKRRQVEVWFLKDLNPTITEISRKGGAIVEAFKAIYQTTNVNDRDIFFYTDADISSDLRLSGSVIYELEQGSSLIITSRWHGQSTVMERGFKEKLSSWIYNLIVYHFLKMDYSDTQNGFKAFRSNCLKAILPLSKDIGFSFDTELLMLAEIKGFSIKEIPMYWVDSKAETNVRLFSDPFKMIKALKRQAAYKKELLSKI